MREGKTMSNGTTEQKLITLAEYHSFSPFEQGYALYMQAELPNSPLKGLTNPYAEGTPEFDDWKRGEFRAMLNVQDGEE